MSEESRALAILCDGEGTILQTLRDDSGLTSGATTLSGLVDPLSSEKAGRFLAAVRGERPAIGWELQVRHGERVVPIRFCGASGARGLMVVASETEPGLRRLLDELLASESEHADLVRSLADAAAPRADGRGGTTDALYQELSRVNNELVNAHRELARKNAALARLNEEKNLFLGMAAHDLRTPLSLVRTYSQFLLEGPGQAPAARTAGILATILRNSDFMLRLVDDLLDASAIEAGLLRLDLRATDLNELVARCAAVGAQLAEPEKVDLDFVPCAGLPAVRIDGPKIEQVVNNLISNAVKYSPEGGTVEVTVKRSAGEVVIAVRDHGPGIPADRTDKLFQPFSRVGGDERGRGKGTGLGLAIVKRIVTGHGGRVRVDTREGAGSTFFVTLPLKGPSGSERT